MYSRGHSERAINSNCENRRKVGKANLSMSFERGIDGVVDKKRKTRHRGRGHSMNQSAEAILHD